MKNLFLILPTILLLFLNGCQFIPKFYPVVGSDGTIYVTEDKNLYALNSDKSLKWKYTARGHLSNNITLGKDNTVYVLGYKGDMYAINPEGNAKWISLYEKFSHDIPVVVRDSIIYVASGNELCTMNLDKTINWKLSTKGKILSSAFFDSTGTLYVVSDNNLHAINPDGTEKWKFSIKIKAYTIPDVVINDSTIYVESGTSLYALSFHGKVKWNKIYGEIFTIAGNDGTVCFGSGSSLYSLNADGKMKWRFIAKGKFYDTPVFGKDGTIYANTDTTLYALNTDGTVKWSLNISNSIQWLYIGNDETIYVISHGPSFALNPDGTEKWSLFFADGYFNFSPPAVDNNKNMYLGCEDGNLYAIKADGTLNWRISGSELNEFPLKR